MILDNHLKIFRREKVASERNKSKNHVGGLSFPRKVLEFSVVHSNTRIVNGVYFYVFFLWPQATDEAFFLHYERTFKLRKG